MTSFRFSGVYPMQFAFFGADGRLDRTAMRRQLEGCLAGGVDGIAILGLGTEVNKLSTAERYQVLEWTAEALAGRARLSVTIGENTVAGQREFARAAAAAGADWVVMQPPQVRGAPEGQYVEFFSAVAEAIDIPFGIQNAPEYTGIGVSNAAIVEMARRFPNFLVLKGEGPALVVQRTIEETDGRLAVFNGRGGLELTDNIRAGCAGMIPGAEIGDLQARIVRLMRTGRPEDLAAAEAHYRDILPLTVFLMQSLDNFLTYGKALAALRHGIEGTVPRGPAIPMTSFGRASLRQAASHLWPDLDWSLLG